MKKLMTTAAITAALMLAASTAVMAQEEDETGMLLSLGDIKVKMGHGDKFRAGVAAWKECYVENDGTDTWNFWSRMDGESGHYTVAFSMANWAAMDADDPAGEACSSKVDEDITPHIERSSWTYAEFMPGWSSTEPGEDIIIVYNMRVDDGRTFNRVIGEVTEAVREVEGNPSGYWYSTYGGDSDAADYFVAIPFENFAEMDMDRDGIWEVSAEHFGEEKAEEMRTAFRASVDDVWSYMYRRVEDLSNMPE